jgi:hypothetical protein
MNRIRRHLTYSNVMITLLAFIVFGGGAYAAFHLPRNSVKSRNIKDGQVKYRDQNRNAKAAWIFVNGEDASKYNSSKGVTVERMGMGEGQYFVRFPFSVRNRALVAEATPSRRLDVVPERCGTASGDAGCAGPNENPRTVVVETFVLGDDAVNDALADRDFWLVAEP